MTHGDLETPQLRKLRLGVMGEFSAGKSTLCNLLLGTRPLTERVTATRLSPVWIEKGAPSLSRELLDGTRTPVDFAELESVPIEGTRSIRLTDEAEVLDMFDLIDFPGISDPNMPTEVWERLVPEVDIVLWCTHANQAWRQSEAEVWRSMPEAVRAQSLLLVTRFDTIGNERDKARVLARVRHETEGLFAGIFPISLTHALASLEDPEGWDASGAEPFIAHLVSVIAELQMKLESGLIEPRAPYRELDGRVAHASPAVSQPDAATATATAAEAEPEPDLALALEGAAPTASESDDPAGSSEGLQADTDPVDNGAQVAPEAAPDPVKVKSPISLMPRRGAAPADATAAPAILPRRVTAQGARRTERPRGDGAVRALRIDDIPPEEPAAPTDLRSAFSPQ
ncbi:MAG: dynamin family protein [Pseudomonadota bacterium]